MSSLADALDDSKITGTQASQRIMPSGSVGLACTTPAWLDYVREELRALIVAQQGMLDEFQEPLVMAGSTQRASVAAPTLPLISLSAVEPPSPMTSIEESTSSQPVLKKRGKQRRCHVCGTPGCRGAWKRRDCPTHKSSDGA
ncbi:hypothetical protein R3P38DRAFT_2758844 [Favolaschia claudopus]|uniref:Uncharacterized protein n=1 Tax=Favolaschia claudopus TaxID=2862362 RepID=A0AAW0E616_9AGAR